MADVFNTLNNINVNGHTEKKGDLTYLSWAWAWQEVKTRYPDASYTVYESMDGWNYFTDGRTCWVKTGVTIEGLELIEYLPVMDFKNRSIPLENVTSMDVNKAIQRSLTKAIARHGLGLYIYAGEDLPEVESHITEKEADALGEELSKANVNMDALLKQYKVRSLVELTPEQMIKIYGLLQKQAKKETDDKQS